MTQWMSNRLGRLNLPKGRSALLGAILLVGLLVEWQYAIRYIYLVPVWELALFDEMLIKAQQAESAMSLWSMAWGYSLNGHWMLLPFWFFWVDFAWDNASGHIPIVMSWVSLLAVAVIVGTRMAQAAPQRWLACLLVAVAIFWPAAMESMISPLQLVTSFSLLFGALALLMLDRPVGWTGIVAAWLCAFLSMASFGYGVVLWPILMLVLLRDRRWWPCIATVVIGVAAVALYSERMGPGYSRSVASLLPQWQTILAYLLAQAGAVVPYLIHRVNVLPAQLAGAVFIAAQLMMTIIVIRGSIWADRSSRWLCVFAAWLLGSMLLTALARHGLGAEQGLASRYLVPSVLYLVCLLALAWRLLRTRPAGRGWVAAVSGGMIVALLAGVPTYAVRFAAIHSNYRISMLAETVGVREVDAHGNGNQWLNLWPLPDVYRYLRENRMSVFVEEWATWVGSDPAVVLNGAARRRCEFSLDMRTPYPGGERVLGWAYSTETNDAPKHVLFVHKGRIAGLAAVMIERTDVAEVFKSRHARISGYYGYLANAPDGEWQGYARFADGSICDTGVFAAAPPVSNPAAS